MLAVIIGSNEMLCKNPREQEKSGSLERNWVLMSFASAMRKIRWLIQLESYKA